MSSADRSVWCTSTHTVGQHGMCQMQLDKHPERTCNCPAYTSSPPHVAAGQKKETQHE